ncbi:hypothetical protein [Zhihengliuella sp.]|uniref:hypothetical protein n=1 Tax=Zhihengliuella sp. TaxID=1954483 RepID=UPI0028126598|nr:hypothetical protein [Zhihengliuella sp.]
MTVWSSLSSGDSIIERFAAQDILAHEGGKVRRRGKVVMAENFANGYGSFNPVFNMGGNPACVPLSIVSLPGLGKALRIGTGPGSNAASGPQGNAATAIARLNRPRRSGIASLSFMYGLSTEYHYNAPADLNAPGAFQIGFGLDTQDTKNENRQFFELLGRPTYPGAATSAENREIGSRWLLRTHRLESGTPTATAVASLGGTMIGENENKTNLAYGRLTFEYGATPRYIEAQMGSEVHDLTNLALPAITEPLQYSDTDPWADFRGGFNPHFGIQARTDQPDLRSAGLLLTNILLTYGDEV